jgi:hypothetical protein
VRLVRSYLTGEWRILRTDPADPKKGADLGAFSSFDSMLRVGKEIFRKVGQFSIKKFSKYLKLVKPYKIEYFIRSNSIIVAGCCIFIFIKKIYSFFLLTFHSY